MAILAMVSDILYSLSSQWAWLWEVHNRKDELTRAVTVSMLALTILWYLWTFVKSRKGIVAPMPPGPRGLPILGYMPFLGTNLHQSFAELAKKHGPIYKLWLGKKLCVVVTSSTLAKEVVRDQDTVFANRDTPIAAFAASYGGLDIAFSPYGTYWRNMRKVFVREMLSNTSLEACYGLRRDEVRKTIREVHSKVGMSMDVGNLAFATEFNVVLNMLWGSRVGSQKANNIGAEFREVTSSIMELVGKPNVSDFFPVLARFDIQGVEKHMKKLFLSVEKIFDSIIDARVKMDTDSGEEAFNNKGKKDFLQILLELKDQEDPTMQVNQTQIKAMLIDIVVGGTDTSATVVEWAMAEIMNKPEVMKKLQQELSDIIGMDNVVEESDITKLPYLDAVVKEALRLHPALPMLVPRCPSDTGVIGGYTIPKNTSVFLNVWAMHRDPKVWENPSDFKPERFLSGTSKWDYSGNNFQYLPFGSGRRICAGIPLAEKMVKYVLASFLHSFNWHLPKGEKLDLTEKFGVVVKKSTPLNAIPTPRLSGLKLYE